MPILDAPQTISFLLMPGFSMLGLMSAVEPLRVANRFGGMLYEWRFLTADGEPAAASNGMRFVPDGCVYQEGIDGPLFVCAGFDPEATLDDRLRARLRRVAAAGGIVGGIDTGSVVLARAGLLDGHRATVHWESLAAFRETFPDVKVKGYLFEIDRNRHTCSGGTSAIDLMLHMIADQHGDPLSVRISEQFIHQRIRGVGEGQRMEPVLRYGVHHPKLLLILVMMERNIESPLPVSEAARLAGISERQMHRLFQDHLGESPSRFYLGIRLERAAQLLAQSDMSVVEIAFACGFSSGSHLSTRFKHRFGQSPRDFRRDSALDYGSDADGTGI